MIHMYEQSSIWSMFPSLTFCGKELWGPKARRPHWTITAICGECAQERERSWLSWSLLCPPPPSSALYSAVHWLHLHLLLLNSEASLRVSSDAAPNEFDFAKPHWYAAEKFTQIFRHAADFHSAACFIYWEIVDFRIVGKDDPWHGYWLSLPPILPRNSNWDLGLNWTSTLLHPTAYCIWGARSLFLYTPNMSIRYYQPNV